MACFGFASTASAKVLLLAGPVKGDAYGKPGKFTGEVRTNRKGPVKLRYIEFNNIDFSCTGPSGQFLAEGVEFTLPETTVKRQGGKYAFAVSEGGLSISGKITKNGNRLRGRVKQNYAFNPDDGPPFGGSTCVGDAAFRAKNIYL